LEHEIYVSIYWEFHHPNWRTPSFFRGVGQPPTSWHRPKRSHCFYMSRYALRLAWIEANQSSDRISFYDIDYMHTYYIFNIIYVYNDYLYIYMHLHVILKKDSQVANHYLTRTHCVICFWALFSLLTCLYYLYTYIYRYIYIIYIYISICI
jgi:hypothetical protein